MQSLQVWLLALVVATNGSRAAAQTLVRVEAGGFPVSNAEVTTWDVIGRLAAGRTDGLGIVRLRLERPITPGSFLLVRRLGFVPAHIALVANDSIIVKLLTAPTELPVLAVATNVLRCPAASEAEAEALWSTSASRYSIGATRLYLGWAGTRVAETVSPEQRGYGDDSAFPISGGGITVGGIYPDTTVRGAILLREPPPYALYERRVNVMGEIWRWRYAPLGEAAAEHFLSARFRDGHALMTLGQSADATVIGFCARDRREAEIEGELLVAANGLLRSARWFYRLAHEDEDAGGEATFAATPFEGAQYLIAMRGSSWRRAGRNLYNQDRYERIAWRLGRTLQQSQLDRASVEQIIRMTPARQYP